MADFNQIKSGLKTYGKNPTQTQKTYQSSPYTDYMSSGLAAQKQATEMLQQKQTTPTQTTTAPQAAPAYVPPPPQYTVSSVPQNNTVQQYLSLLQTPTMTPDLQKQATSEYDRQQQGIQSQIDMLNEMRQADIGTLQQTNERAKRGLEDTMYQRYLQTMENMNKRGLLTSGLTADATTRLGMTRQEELADLYAQMQGRVNDLNKYYSPQLAQLSAQQQAISPQTIQQQLLKQEQDRRMEQAKMVENALRYTAMTPYEQQSLLLRQQENSQKQADAQTQGQGQTNFDRKSVATSYYNTSKQRYKEASDLQKQIQNLDPKTDGVLITQTEQARQALVNEGRIAEELYRVVSAGQFNTVDEIIQYRNHLSQTPATPTSQAQTKKTQAQINTENERSRKRIALAQFQQDTPRLQLVAANIDDNDASKAIETLGKAGLRTPLTMKQLQQIEDYASRDERFYLGKLEKSRIRNAKKMLPLINQYGFEPVQ